jgi:Ca2+-binding RTX toxin-like protein
MVVTLGAGSLSTSGATGNLVVTGGLGAKTITLGSGNDTITTGLGNETIHGGNGSDTFITHVGDGSETIHGGTGASWVDTINLHSGTMSLGAYGTDWTLSITSGSIVSNDTVNHAITLSQDAAGTIHMPDAHSVAFDGIEKITY